VPLRTRGSQIMGQATRSLQQKQGAEQGNKFMEDQERACQSLAEHLVGFAKENPGAAALWCFGIGFVIGWKLKPW